MLASLSTETFASLPHLSGIMPDHYHQEHRSRGVLYADTDAISAVLGPLRVQVGSSLQQRIKNELDEAKHGAERSPDTICVADQVFFDHLCDQDVVDLKVDETSGTTFVEQFGGFGECNMLSLLELMQDPFELSTQHKTGTGPQATALTSHIWGDINRVAPGQSTTGNQDPLQRKKRNQNQSRARQRQEVRFLREYVKGLEEQRHKLFDEYKIHRKNSNVGEKTTKAGESSAEQTKEEIFQRALALKRRVERTKLDAERVRAENSRLRGLIEQQCQVARQFQTEFRVKNELCMPTAAELAFVNLELHLSVSPQPACQPPDLSSTPESIEEDLDVQYQQLGFIWGTCGFTDQPPQSCAVKPLDEWHHRNQDGQGNRILENVHSRIVPFSPESVVGALWESLSRGIQTPNGGELKVCKKSGDEIEIFLHDTFSELGNLHRSSNSAAPVRLTSRIALKKFVKANRIVLVQSSVIDIEAEKCRLVRLHGKGWSVLQCLGVQGRSNKDESKSCFVQTCMHVVPAAHSQDNGTLDDGGASFSTVPLEFIANYRQTRDFVYQLVENQLVDECLQSLASPTHLAKNEPTEHL